MSAVAKPNNAVMQALERETEAANKMRMMMTVPPRVKQKKNIRKRTSVVVWIKKQVRRIRAGILVDVGTRG